MGKLLQDIRYSTRVLRKSPGFTVVAVVALALGIGATTAIFSVVYAVALRPLPFKEPERLAKIWGKFEREGIPKNWISEPELYDLREQTQSFEGFAAMQTFGVNLAGNDSPERVSTAFVSAALFPLLRVQPSLGRTFTNEEDQAGANRVALVSNGLWKRRFASDPGIIDGTIVLNGQNYTVLGVMPPGFNYPDDVDLWVPIGFDKANPSNRGNHGLEVLARIKSDVSPGQAVAEISSLATALAEKYPNNYSPDGGFSFYMVPLHEEVVGNIKPMLILLIIAVALVLLIACANVANMLLARATVREREVAIRAALGAGRGRLIRQLLTESVLLAAVGGALGVLLAYFGVRLFVTFGPQDIPRLSEIGVDALVLGLSLLVTIMTGIIFGLAPALHISKPDLNNSLKEGGRGTTGGRHFVRNLLVVAEVSFALMLLIMAGLTIKSFQRLLNINLGFRTENVLTMRLTLPQARYNPEQAAPFYQQLLDQIKALPGVQSAGAVTILPLSGSYSSGTTVVEDTSAGEGLQRFNGHPFLEADRRNVTPGYFDSLGVTLLKGRLITEADDQKAPRVAVVDEKFARRFWPDGNAVGKRVAVGGTRDNMQWGEIVGVISHIRHYGTNKEGQDRAYFPEGREQIYFPLAQNPSRTMYLAISTATDPTSLINPVRNAVLAMDKDLPVYEVKTMEQLVSKSVANPRLNVVLMSIFAAVALILSAVGIYGVMSYSVTQRTHEIGIRMALGATPSDVLRLVVGQGLALTGVGVGIGLASAFFLTRLMSTLLFGVSTTDPGTFVVIALVLAAVAFVACFIPARRATRVDPMVALRYE
jgi:putative ABC transport system permease protein